MSGYGRVVLIPRTATSVPREVDKFYFVVTQRGQRGVQRHGRRHPSRVWPANHRPITHSPSIAHRRLRSEARVLLRRGRPRRGQGHCRASPRRHLPWWPRRDRAPPGQATVHHHWPRTLDPVWIPAVAAQGWLILTRDTRITQRPAELAAVQDSGARMVALAGFRLRHVQDQPAPGGFRRGTGDGWAGKTSAQRLCASSGHPQGRESIKVRSGLSDITAAAPEEGRNLSAGQWEGMP